MTRSVALISMLLLVCCSCQRGQPVGEFPRHLVDYFTGRTPLQAVGMMEDEYLPDQRRQGINRLADRSWGRRPPYTERYAEIAQFDSDYLVRATAIRALNRSRDQTATAVFIRALADPSPLVRQEAAKALANIPDANAATPLMRLLNDPQENRDVRIAAADALRHYSRADAAQALAATLGAREFAVAWQSRRSLISMTGRDLRYDESAWLEYLTGPDRPFS